MHAHTCTYTRTHTHTHAQQMQIFASPSYRLKDKHVSIRDKKHNSTHVNHVLDHNDNSKTHNHSSAGYTHTHTHTQMTHSDKNDSVTDNAFGNFDMSSNGHINNAFDLSDEGNNQVHELGGDENNRVEGERINHATLTHTHTHTHAHANERKNARAGMYSGTDSVFYIKRQNESTFTPIGAPAANGIGVDGKR